MYVYISYISLYPALIMILLYYYFIINNDNAYIPTVTTCKYNIYLYTDYELYNVFFKSEIAT